jgi:hypothetical protein
MRTIESMIGRSLEWVQPIFFKQRFELRNSSLVVATLELPKFLSYTARAESADGCWTFERKGIWRPVLVIRACDQQTPLATFPERPFSRKHPLTLPSGRTMTMHSDFFGWSHRLVSESGEELAAVKRAGFFRGSYRVSLRRKGFDYPEYPWLVLFLWYHMVIERRRAHAHATVG